MTGATGAIGTMVLRRDSPVPLYHQVAEHLRELIGSGELATGTLLPNEIDLAQRFSLSRPTMRQALDELVRDGLISRRRGIGTIVTPREFHRGAHLTSVHDDLVAAGRRPATEVLSIVVEPRCADVAAAYDDDTDIVAITRLRSADDEPLVVMRNWLPLRYADLTAAMLETGGLYGVMRQRGDVPVTARKEISAVGAATFEARLLGVRRGTPLLRVRHVGYDAARRVIDVGDHLYRGDAYTVDVPVT
ncbi:GntR family transcriptional regulator [Desertimonas flava]|uniref:GntR family transcriptional regulator n=1 Tax=Desertimonas flava TaxID=2064846 RepID=UPI000E342062|nr:GntR family transcriptional regulator [Desertimonas flava]